MEQMTVNSVAALFPSTKSEIKNFAAKMVESALDGHSDPLKVKVQLSAMKQTIEEIEKNEEFKACVLNAAEKYHKLELADMFNAKIEIVEVAPRYDYSVCGMPEYDNVCAEIQILTERKKALETRLKTIKNEEDFICPVTGEIIKLKPATKESTTSVKITINK